MPRKQLDTALMRKSAGQAAAMLRALGNEDRLLLLCEISQGEKAVNELQELLGLHQPSLSQQLGVLRTQGLVSTRREGKFIYYTIADPAVFALLKLLYKTYCTKQ
jgi:DNA-binding transcriptional ArsR family regulator